MFTKNIYKQGTSIKRSILHGYRMQHQHINIYIYVFLYTKHHIRNEFQEYKQNFEKHHKNKILSKI